MLLKDEWVISRVFQKNGSGGSSGGAAGGKKTRLSSTISLYPEVSSPSSASLPPLLDASPYAGTSSAAAAVTDRESCSYDGGDNSNNSNARDQHVPWFSTIAAAAATATAAASSYNPHQPPPFDLSPSPIIGAIDTSRYPRNGVVSAFPNLRSLQENLHLPFFFSQVAPPIPTSGDPSVDMGISGSTGNWPVMENQKMDTGRLPMGATELDCMWSY